MVCAEKMQVDGCGSFIGVKLLPRIGRINEMLHLNGRLINAITIIG